MDHDVAREFGVGRRARRAVGRLGPVPEYRVLVVAECGGVWDDSLVMITFGTLGGPWKGILGDPVDGET